MAKQWGGRFQGETDAIVEQLGESVSFDARLAPWDIRASIAHARMLGKCGILCETDVQDIVQGLEAVAEDIRQGHFQFDTALEDVHTNIEVALVNRIGEAGKRLHTARSRNDQIATDVRLWARDQAGAIAQSLQQTQRAVLDFAEAHIEVILPGCTHLQPAQPVLLAHHMLAYFEMFARDCERFAQLRERINVLPLGAAALAGVPYPIDREHVARELGFERVAANSMDAVSDRDFLVEFCANASLVMMHLSRFCEELVIWSSPAFGYIEIGDAFTTGSSIMPQKKNPDVAEIVRGKTGRVYGDLMALLTLMKGLPLTYNRDQQEDKEPAFDASDTVQLCLAAVARMIPAIRVRRDRMEGALREGFLEATDLADYLAGKGVPFREAHGITGRIVLHALEAGKRLPELTIEEFQQFSGAFESDVYQVLSPEAIVQRRDHIGGTAPNRVRDALEAARRSLG